MKISVPINNTVEVVICDVFVKVQVSLQTEQPLKTTEAKIAIDSLKIRLNHIASEMAYRITESIGDEK